MQDDAVRAFVENTGFFGLENGIPRSVARVMGYMLICEPAQQSAPDICNELQMSAGAVSNALMLLQRVGLVKRASVPGKRKLYYEIDENGWYRAIEQRLKSIPKAITLAETGLQISPTNSRLQAMKRTYAAFDQELAAIIAKLKED